MTSNMTAIVLALAAASFAAPVAAQSSSAAAPAAGQQAPAQPSIVPSKGAHQAIVDLQTAVNAGDAANIPARLAAAEAVASTPEDRYLIAALRYEAAAAAKDNKAIATSIQSLLQSSLVPQADVIPLTFELGVAHYRLKQYDQAASALEKVLAANAANKDAMVVLAETRQAQGRTEDAVKLIQRAVAQAKAGGAKAPEDWYKRGLGLAYEAKLPVAIELSREWLAAYPSEGNWRDALRIYRGLAELDDGAMLDALRLQRAAGALASDAEIHRYGYLTVTRGYPAEAKALMDTAVAAGAIDPKKDLFKEIIAEAEQKSAGEKATLADAAKAGLTSAKAKSALTAGDLLYGYGDYAKAAELYRAALTKEGADRDLINLHLGMALAQAGDKAGAATALNAVGGPNAELAKYWLVFVNSKG